ncbi:unnamed protein product [Cylicostephanus goldi]|uniref:Uncharacterized protein n=1 Tax=Cylicostephanus goldi TaxID=71465 RepID=A0A3P6RRE8_CYLGO|nr:unnamed protein product [Cylicostephanus goldi]
MEMKMSNSIQMNLNVLMKMRKMNDEKEKSVKKSANVVRGTNMKKENITTQTRILQE